MRTTTHVGFGYLSLASLFVVALTGCTVGLHYHQHDHQTVTTTLPELIETIKGLKDVKDNRIDSEQAADERLEDRDRASRTGGSILPR